MREDISSAASVIEKSGIGSHVLIWEVVVETVRLYWQFKNGTIARIDDRGEIPVEDSWDVCYDRSLGGYVLYDRYPNV